MKKALFIIAVGVILLPLTSDAQHKGGQRTALTTLDMIEIEQLAIRYSYGLDTGAENGYLYADVFTPDGEFVGRQVPLTQGREALARVARTVRKANSQYVRHFITNHVIEPSPRARPARCTSWSSTAKKGNRTPFTSADITKTCTSERRRAGGSNGAMRGQWGRHGRAACSDLNVVGSREID